MQLEQLDCFLPFTFLLFDDDDDVRYYAISLLLSLESSLFHLCFVFFSNVCLFFSIARVNDSREQ